MSNLFKGPRERAEYGCTLTFENDNGQRLVVVRKGPPMAGFRQACAIALSHDETFRVISYSTPETIFRDLTGRMVMDGNTTVMLPELQLAARYGLRHMLHRRLLEASEAHKKDRDVRYRRAADKAAR